jgi:hypothetical protein
VEQHGAYEEVRVKEVERERFAPLYITSIRVIKLRSMRWAGHVTRFGDERNEHMVVVEKYEGKRPLGRPRCIWEEYIIIGWREISWIHLTLIGTIGRIMCEADNATSFAVKCEVILNCMRTLTFS